MTEYKQLSHTNVTFRNFINLEYIGSRSHQAINLYHTNMCKYTLRCVKINETPNTLLITISIANFRCVPLDLWQMDMDCIIYHCNLIYRLSTYYLPIHHLSLISYHLPILYLSICLSSISLLFIIYPLSLCNLLPI